MSENQARKWYQQSGVLSWIGVGAIAVAYFTGYRELVLPLSLVTIIAAYASRGSFSRENIGKRKGQFQNWHGSAVSRQKVVAAMFAGLVLSWVLGFIVFEVGSDASNLMMIVMSSLILVLAVTVVTTKVKPDSPVSNVETRVPKPRGRVKKSNGGTHG